MTIRYLQRYRDATRLNHWLVVLLFFGAALSGLSLFHPNLFFLSALFGGGPWTRIVHPYFGILMVLSFLALFVAMWRDNLIGAIDRAWLRAAPRLVAGDKAGMPPAGKYNAGQKLVFWAFAASLALLFATGFVFWRPWFAGYFPITLVRLAVVVHAASAVVLILSVIVHIYAAIWVSGTTHAMTRGTVSEGWAKANHPLWYEQMTGRGDGLDQGGRR
jgi:formate dehydrogenase subunit gamma